MNVTSGCTSAHGNVSSTLHDATDAHEGAATSSKPLIYYVEDDENIRNLTRYALEHSGFEVIAFHDGNSLLELCMERPPAAVLLDIMLPGIDGIELMKQLRAERKTTYLPIMLLTAKDAEYDKVSGLDAGADDYLAKPFGMMELVSRVNALLRRSTRFAQAQLLQAPTSVRVEKVEKRAAIEVFPDEYRTMVDGRPVTLTRKEFRLLCTLVEQKGRVLTRDILLERVWNLEYPGGTRTVDMHIKTLRQKLREVCPGSESSIETVRGVGYRFRDIAR